MAASVNRVKRIDIQRDLDRLSTRLFREMGFPRALFESDPSLSAKTTFSFPCVHPQDLYFTDFYGDIGMVTQSQFWRKIAVKSKARCTSPFDVSPELMRDKIAECVDSVEDADKEFATLKLSIGRVFFEAPKRISMDDQRRIFEGNISGDQHSISLPNNDIKFYHTPCEWTSPNSALQFLAKNGFSITSREPLRAEVVLRFQGSRFKKWVGDNDCLYFGNRLKLNPTSLTVENWEIQYTFPRTHCIMHGFPSSNDIIIRSHVKRDANFAELLALNDEQLPSFMHTAEHSKSFIRRTDFGFESMEKYNKWKQIAEIGNGERIHLQYKGVSCFINLVPKRLFMPDKDFFLTNDKGCESVIEFPLTENREELIEVVTRLSLALFSKSNDDNEVPLTLSPEYINESGTRVSWLEVQAILRLHDKRGDLFQLLGLGPDPSRREYKRKAIALNSLLLRSHEQGWFKQMRLNFSELKDKLSSACLAYDIDLTVCMENE